MALRIAVNWTVLFVIFMILVVALGAQLGPVGIYVALIVLVAIGVWRTRSIHRAR
ncbi:hypothetical protein [Aeromicrobium sp.]|uniref:hypothetical protein n=1 Tax=Aeromicrobium sp. TaxID=1871063 RepID=UPI0030BB0E07